MLPIHKMTSDETNDRNTSSQYFCICPTHTKGALHLTFLYTGCPLFAESSNGLGGRRAGCFYLQSSP